MCQVHLRGLHGPICNIIIDATADRRGVQLAIELETGIDPSSQRLICGVRELLHNDCIGDFKDSTHGTVDLLLIKRTVQEVAWLQQATSWHRGYQKVLRENPEATRDYGVVLEAVSHEGWNLQYATDAFKANREIVLAAVSVAARGCGTLSERFSSLQHAADALKADREIVLVAVSNSGLALQFAADSIKAEREIVLAAVSRDGLALRYAADQLKADREIVLTAVSENVGAILEAADTLKADRAFAQEVVARDRDVLAFSDLIPMFKKLEREEAMALRREAQALKKAKGKAKSKGRKHRG